MPDFLYYKMQLRMLAVCYVVVDKTHFKALNPNFVICVGAPTIRPVAHQHWLSGCTHCGHHEPPWMQNYVQNFIMTLFNNLTLDEKSILG